MNLSTQEMIDILVFGMVENNYFLEIINNYRCKNPNRRQQHRSALEKAMQRLIIGKV